MSNSSDDTADPDHPLEPARTLLTTGGQLAGLSYAEIAVYVELACNGPSSVISLTKQLPRSRKQIYRTVKSLDDKRGLIEGHVCPSDPTTTLYRVTDDTD